MCICCFLTKRKELLGQANTNKFQCINKIFCINKHNHIVVLIKTLAFFRFLCGLHFIALKT